MKTTTLIAASLLTALLGGCTPYHGPTPAAMFSEGEFVRSIISNQRGQIIRVRCWEGEKACYYDVRFVGLSMTTATSIMGSDGPISTEPLAVVQYMKEYELKAT